MDNGEQNKLHPPVVGKLTVTIDKQSLLCYDSICTTPHLEPKNTVAYSDQPVKLSCCLETQPGEVLRWNYYPMNSRDRAVVYNGNAIHIEYKREFKISHENNCSYLMMDYVQLSHAGKYVCRSLKEEMEVQLVVLAAEPACKEKEFLTEEGYHHNITFQCSVKYRGNLDPFIEWKESGISLQESTSNNLVKKGLSKILISSLEIQIPIYGRSSDLKIERFLSISGIWHFIGNNSEYNVSMERRIQIPLETETKNNIDGRDNKCIILVIVGVLVGFISSAVMIVIIFFLKVKGKFGKQKCVPQKTVKTDSQQHSENEIQDSLLKECEDDSKKKDGPLPAKVNAISPKESAAKVNGGSTFQESVPN